MHTQGHHSAHSHAVHGKEPGGPSVPLPAESAAESHSCGSNCGNCSSQSSTNDLATPVAIVIAGALIAGAIFYGGGGAGAGGGHMNQPAQAAQAGDNKIDAKLLAVRPDDHIRGNKNAEVLLVEYSDLECPFCKRFDETMKEVMNQYGNSGQVAWVYRHFPLDQIHPKARKEAEAAECANELGGNDAFWKYMDKIFEITPSNNGLDPAKLPEIAGQIGLDVNAFNQCLSSGKYASRVQKDFENGAQAGVQGTPFTAVINVRTGEQKQIGGALPLESVKAAIEELLGRK